MADVTTNPNSKQSEALSNGEHFSYGTFTPYFVIDSEYLKTLVGGKGHSCELTESASLQDVPGAYFPPELHQTNGFPITSSGVTVQSPAINTSYAPNFFSECDQQVLKLFNFMDFHLTKIENEVETVRRTNGRESIHNPSHKDVDTLSNDSGVCDNESKHLLVTLDDDEDRIQSSVGLLTRLREVLVSLQESLSSSFAALDELVDMHGNHHDNKQGRKHLDKKIPKQKEYEERLDTCMENLDHELNTLYRKQDVKIDGHGRVRIRTESKITIDVRNSSTSCVTYLHFLLFLITLVLISYMYMSVDADEWKWIVYLRLLRSPLLIVLLLYLYGTNLKVWANKHIDYVAIFDHNPKATPTPKHMFKVAGVFCLFFTVLIVLLLVSSPFTDEVPGKIVPLIMWSALIVYLVNPFNISLRKGRFSLILTCVRILLAPFTFVYFGDFWFADQLNSTVAILLDLQYLVCYMIADTWYGDANTKVCTSSGNGIRPVISCLPALWRLLQCIRCFYDTKNVKHLLNAAKYFTTFPVVIFATMFSTKVGSNFSIYKLDLPDVGWILILWFISSLVHAIYTFIWDIYCDWGLWNFSKGTYFRKTLVFKYKVIYMFAIIFDLVLRFLWALKLTLAIVWHLDSDLIYTVLIIAEILRRFVWNFLRVEYAHILEKEEKD